MSKNEDEYFARRDAELLETRAPRPESTARARSSAGSTS